ncbi:uncharacterized protein PHACADRAFT_185348 [Phanerochaete carnosa HHB-10118-sp]|uniref:BZIP domain-containing protein n=1 Tax=Phanerochaete carnosa (strain HHB-10118-sp) TaxID=650164 RepID=K5UWK4_PHACS|nr:uncharacterized protein PHACADRAFT_185348 [Phanerochaete carnosa HHB-10118-sp]EKM54421.1 hypothetical protein PHACADRAFT_185348 [Phanerochaete carnosa HHB-10118-sp]
MSRDLVGHTPPQSGAEPHAVPSPSITSSADTLAAHLEALAGIPACIRKLERKHAASEKSIRMKSKRITELEAEVRRLEAENAQLQAKLSSRY